MLQTNERQTPHPVARRLLCLALLATPATGDGTTDPTADSVAITRDCGAYCVGIVLRKLSLPLDSFESLRSELHTDAEGRTTMLDIVRCLKQRGVNVQIQSVSRRPPTGLAIALADLTSRGTPASHFVVLEPDAGAGGCPV